MINSEKTKNAPKRSRKTKVKQQKGKQPNPLHRLQIRDGMTAQTRDEFLESGVGYTKPGFENRGYYRTVTVLKHNSEGELMLVVLVNPDEKHRGILVENNKGRKSKYRPFVETKNHQGESIKPGKYVLLNKNKKLDIKKKDFKKMKKRCKSNKLNADKYKRFKN